VDLLALALTDTLHGTDDLAHSALPHAPVIPDRADRPRAARLGDRPRAVLAGALERAARAVEPAPTYRPAH
jgi:hypothetical protein